jgi:pyruvate dehydrogenase E2 component (dihydrolipoamide acetyltransferase)
MMQALTMPAWGMEDAPGTVIEWLAEEGSQISPGDELVEIETSKLTNVVESPFSGTLARIVLRKGDHAPTGALLAVIADSDTSDEAIESFIVEHRHEVAASTVSEPIEKLFETASGKIRVMTLEGSEGVPIVLLHGFGADWTNWSFLSHGLAQNRTVHMPDLPGHGASFKDLGADPLATVVDSIVEVVAKLDGKLHLAGHSLGGLVAVRIAARIPEQILSVSLLAPAGLSGQINGEFLDAFADADRRKPARSAIEMLVSDPGTVSLAMINDVIRARRVEGAKEALHGLRSAIADGDTQSVELGSDLKKLDKPVQLILGEKDRIIDMGKAPPDIELNTISGAGHLLHMEKAGEVQKILASFTEKHDE